VGPQQAGMHGARRVLGAVVDGGGPGGLYTGSVSVQNGWSGAVLRSSGSETL
jgi:hypothetical protein